MLEIKNLTKTFGGLVAVDKVNLKLNKNEILGLIGPNGSGKTTCLNLISGIYDQDEGVIKFQDEEIQDKEPYKIFRSGLARTFQNIRLLEEETVKENITLGYSHKIDSNLFDILFHTKNYKNKFKFTEKKVNEIIDILDLEDKRNYKIKNLPYGEKRMVEIGRALISEPKVILMDEPAAGLNNEEQHKLENIIKEIKNRGTSIILVEHEMGFVSEVIDRGLVLNFGKKIVEGTFKELMNNPQVKKAYLGEE